MRGKPPKNTQNETDNWTQQHEAQPPPPFPPPKLPCGLPHLSVLLQISFVQASVGFWTIWALVRYRGIHIPNAPVAKETAADASDEKT